MDGEKGMEERFWPWFLRGLTGVLRNAAAALSRNSGAVTKRALGDCSAGLTDGRERK